MKPKGLDVIKAAWSAAWKPKARLSVSEWSCKNVIADKDGTPFSIASFPWLTEFLDACSDYTVEEQMLIGPTQSGKTKAQEAAIAYFISEDPGDSVFYTHKDDAAEEFAEERLMPLLEACPEIKKYYPQDKNKKRKTEVLFTHMVMQVLGASVGNLQSKTRRLIFGDEVWLWLKGAYYQAKRRSSAPHLRGRRKFVSVTNAGSPDGDVEMIWKRSDQRVWSSQCPVCEGVYPIAFSPKHCRRLPQGSKAFFLQWDDNETTRPGGRWDYTAMEKTIRLECPCGHVLKDEPITRNHLRTKGRYVCQNSKASGNLKAWWFSGVAVNAWSEVVTSFLQSKESADAGNIEPLKEFTVKTLAEPWVDADEYDVTTNPSSNYEMGEEWAELDKDSISFLTIDVQKDHFWYVIRDWLKTGASRLRRCGRIETWDDIEELRITNRIDKSKVFVDASYNEKNTTYTEVYARGYRLLRGSSKEYFPIKTRNGKIVKRPISLRRFTDPGIGTRKQGRAFIEEWMWSTLMVKDYLDRLYAQKGLPYELPKDVPQEYLDQMMSEKRKMISYRGGLETYEWQRIGKKPNHLWDCESMQIVAAIIARKLFSQHVSEEGETEEE